MNKKTLSKISATVVLFGASLIGHAQQSEVDSDFGVVVMAHGGSPEWNAGVLEAVQPLESEIMVEVAFGMADAVSIQESVTLLEERGAQRIGVVRLFVSGESWYERTGQILGLEAGAPPRPQMHAGAGEHDAHAAHRMEFWQVDSDAQFAMSREGLIEAPEMSVVLSERVLALSEDPGNEDVLILAHGPEDDAENARWLEYMNEHARRMRYAVAVNDVRVATLREDWPEKREGAVAEIRSFIERSTAAGRTAIVIPFRVHGFGPYAEVLEGLDYVSDGTGLVPHRSVTDWIRRQAAMLR